MGNKVAYSKSKYRSYNITEKKFFTKKFLKKSKLPYLDVYNKNYKYLVVSI